VSSETLSIGLKEAFIQLIAKQTGLVVRERDRATLSEKIFSRMKVLKLESPEEYYQLLNTLSANSYKEWQNLAILLTNIESYFFRDREQFNLLRENILPEIIQRQQASKTIRICSAGCSSGEEPYSIAILLQQLIPDLKQWHLIILGLDINQAALQKAQIGIYRPWSFRKVEPIIQQQYFQQINDQYHINQEIKQMLEFQHLNLVKDPFPPPNSELRNFDLIICRNVFIYFEESAIAKILNKFYHALQPSGYLITGHAELYGQNLSRFQAKTFPESIVYQRHKDDLLDTSFTEQSEEYYYPALDGFSGQGDYRDLENAFTQNNIKMQRVALNLLRQLPPNTKMPKLGNLTAAELILQLEAALKNS
jgi:chemotaxis protein methyltransferase CheR